MDNFKLFVKPDLSYNSFYPFVKIDKIHNLLLIPKDNKNLCDLQVGNKLMFRNKKNKSKLQQSIINKLNDITIKNIQYIAYNIAPGLKINLVSIDHNNYTLSFDGNETNISLIYNSIGPKLLIGNLILSNNYYAYFNNNDNIELFIDDEILKAKLVQKYNKFNYFSGNKINTVLEILNDNNLHIIQYINSGKYIDKFYCRSLDTTRFIEKGSVTITNRMSKRVSGIVECEGIDNNYKQSYYIDNSLIIKNLSVGKYKLNIIVDNDTYADTITIEPFIDNSNILNNKKNTLYRLSRMNQFN